MTPVIAIATAIVFTWLGMVVAISFIEAPLKFRAPDVTVRIGLGIGRIVFRALNRLEVGFAAILLATILINGTTGPTAIAAIVAIAILTTQLVVVRPRLNRRSDRVLAGEELPRSRGHIWYVALESAKALCLVATGVLLLTT